MALIDDKYAYTVTLNGIQSELINRLVECGLYGRNDADVIRRILDERFQQMTEMPKVDLGSLMR
jgi:Arc/MetJ-type ribon-helix-helix transcriptional regulator